MAPKFDKKQKLELIKRYLSGESVSSIASSEDISRVIFYRWLSSYKKYGVKGLTSGTPGRPSGIKKNTNKHSSDKKLTPHERIRMVEEVVLEGKRPTDIAKKYDVSRITLYKWVKRYKESEDKRIGTFQDRKREYERYYNQAPELYEDAVLSVVRQYPDYGIRKILKSLPSVGGKPILSHHGVQNVLKRYDLSTLEKRREYAQGQETAFTSFIDQILAVITPFFASTPRFRKRVLNTVGVFLASVIVTIIVFGAGGVAATTFAGATLQTQIGLVFAYIALFMGSVFFLYSLKYYLTLAIVLSYSQSDSKQGRKSLIARIINEHDSEGEVDTTLSGLASNVDNVSLERHPYISVQIPFFNEKYVAERAITAATNFDYEGEYEVIVCDDSTDDTTDIVRAYQRKFLSKGEKLKIIKGKGWNMAVVEVKPGVTLKHLHRTSRSGYKGAALKLALTLVDPRTEFISIFDADFVPYPDSLTLFLKYFKAGTGTIDFSSGEKSKIAAVQGYQWHVLNKSENWITRGVRSEYAGSYVIERSGQEIYGGLKHISGSVYMIRRDVLQEIGWDTSITEDYELTLKLYAGGYRVMYTPYIQAPAECVSTLKRLIRQRMRWAEGHSFNVKKMIVPLMLGTWQERTGRSLTALSRSNTMQKSIHRKGITSRLFGVLNTKITNEKEKQRSSEKVFVPSPLTIAEKVEFLFNIPYYFQAFLFLIGTLAWLISEAVFPARLPFWTTLWGWSLVLTNMFALPLVNSIGLFLEESEERDYLGIASFFALSYILVPFQAYAALKGFVEKEEGGWFRTPKTGRITDVFNRGRFYRFIQGILPGKVASVQNQSGIARIGQKYLNLTTSNNQFDSFTILPKKNRYLGHIALTLVVGLSALLSFAGNRMPQGVVSDLPIASGISVQHEPQPITEQVASIFTAKEVFAAGKHVLTLYESSYGIGGVYLLLIFASLSMLIYILRRRRGFVRSVLRPVFVTVLVFLWILTSWPGLPFIGFPFQIQEALAADSFRVTEYYLTTSDFTGTTYDLTLDQDLADDFYVLVRGSKIGNGGSNPDNDYVRVFEVPNATGELADSGANNVISLSRHVADVDWEGVVTVVECVADCSVSGFQLVDIVETSITASSTSGTDTSTAWSDINDIVLFGGFHGGGAEFEADATSTDGNAVQTRLYPTSTNTINWERNSSTALTAVTLTTFVVEFGTEWTVQRVNLAGSVNGPGCDASGEYGTGAISSVARDNTWVWGTGHSDGLGIGDSVSGTLITLGDGQNQNANESTVAYCGEYNHAKNLDIYTMTHPNLSVDYRFKADGNAADEDITITVDSASSGYRFSWITNGTNGSGSAHPRDRFWARYTADTQVTLSHGYTGQDWPAWVMGVDFSGIQVSNATPTITFNNVPFDNEHTGDSTPNFEFTGTDPDGSADIIYHIQIDDDYQFGSPLIECESDTTCALGSGTFTNTVSGGDTSPFNEGELIRFTPSIAMTDNVTYYWRLRAEDDSVSGGGGFYSNWSTVQSVTYNSSIGISEWFQTTDEQFATGTLSGLRTSGIDSVEVAGGYQDPIFETGSETISDSLQWTSVSLSGTYSTAPVIIATPVTANNCEAQGTCAGNSTSGGGGKYPIPLVRNVTTSGFDISMCVDGGGSQSCATGVSGETFHWFAFDVDDAANYNWIEVDTQSGVSVDGSGTAVTYSTSFSGTPVVWLQAQTYSQGGNLGASSWANPTSSTGFTLNGCAHDAASVDVCYSSGSSETFGYVAIDVANANFPSGVNFQSSSQSQSNSEWGTASFSPSYSSARVMVEQNSESGTQKPHYPWARSVTTTGMDFRVCEQDDGTTCNTHNAEEVYWLAVEQSTSSSSGTITSAPIDYDSFVGGTGWNEVYWNEDETNGSVSMQVYYTETTTCDTIVPDGTLSGNSSGFATSPIDISNLSTTTHNEICLRATLSDSGGSPYLEDWAVSVPENIYLLIGLSSLVFLYIRKRQNLQKILDKSCIV